MYTLVSIRFGTPGKADVERRVSLADGASVLDALRAAGVAVVSTEEAKGESCCGAGMVHAIDGVASDETRRRGWMYAVNGRPPSVGPGEAVLRDGDVVEWVYR